MWFVPFQRGAENISLSHSCVPGLWSLVCGVWVVAVRNSGWCLTQSGLTVGGISVGIGQLWEFRSSWWATPVLLWWMEGPA